MNRFALPLTLAAAMLAVGSLPAFAQDQAEPTPTANATTPATQFERDRAAILSQAGNFHVRFDMRETVNFLPDYTPLEPKTSGGEEIVRVVYDEGNRISLQHILVMVHEGQTFVIKHWRQDWVYEPETVLTYAGPDEWVLTPVSADERRGAWSQTVWQTDDSPRYGGVGHWSYENGLSEWTSNDTWRPLARRDAVRSPVYDRYLGVNRHALTPWGWVHIQDNMKLSGKGGGELVAIVQEDVINSYDASTAFSPKAGDDYWAATQDYWAAVRDAWDAAIAVTGRVYVEEEAQTGVVTGPPLMDLAQKIQDGGITTEAAIAQARTIIETATKR